MAETHGSHWGSFSPDDIEGLIHRLLPTMLEQGTLLACAEMKAGSNGDAGQVCGLTWPDTDLRGLCLCSRAAGAGSFDLESAYPFAAVGVRHRLTIEKIEEWENRIEALLHVSFEGVHFAFFDTRYFENKSHYREGHEAEFVLAGLAYILAVTKPMPVVIHDPEKIRAFRGVSSTPLVIRTEGAAMLMRVSGNSDDFSFQAPVKEVAAFEFDGQTVWRLRATVLRCPQNDLDIEIHAPRAVIDGSPPEVGEDIAGNIWLQGYLCR